MPSVDRSKTSPFLLRCFIRNQAHSDIQFFNPNSPALQRGEYGIYVWKDTTLRELVILLRSVGAGYQRPGNAKFSIRHVYTSSPSSSESIDSRGPTYNYKDLGFVFARDLTGEDFLEEKGPSGRGGGRNDPSIRTLENHRIIPGDYLEIAFITSIPPSASALGPSAAGGPGGPARQPLPGGSGPLAARMNGPSDADKAWGIAGDQTGRRRPPGVGGPMRTGGPNGSHRMNPLLSGSNGRPVGDRRDGAPASSAQGGISIMGAGRRASAVEEPSTNGTSRDRRDDDRDRPSRRRDDGDDDMRD
ncbi:hypothetical protein P389DRAFT_169185 [Cystobasidium minutum MCA 4210]|uniref:uncharacterized protein n=1 Tax=Cystobasidium minutum MCA 4210 TaxID=1397322 RepID=UPI0034CD4F45|eukprot:jgi/Rhomi1/169185/fgenesh1_kg.3_\